MIPPGDVVVLLFGGFLVLIAIVGGGLEVKEVKIPPLGKGARLLAAIAGVILILIGVGMRQEAAPPGDHQASQSPVTFSVADSLGEDEISEKVRILIDGREAGTLTVDEHYREANLNVTV